MGAHHTAVQWSRHKRVYDAIAAGSIAAYLVNFLAVGVISSPAPHEISPPILLMRALGSGAFVLLSVILLIGPLARLAPRTLPLLYNRRHLGVMCFALALLHALVALGFYGGFGVVNPVAALLARPAAPGEIPFEWFGAAALLWLFLMAATSHDFWLTALGPRLWKWLHMGVYLAYAALVAHVALGALQREPSGVYPALVLALAGLVAGAHLLAALRETARAVARARADKQGWADVAAVEQIPMDRAAVVNARGESIAVFRHDAGISAVANRCAHQGGPLGEGQIIDGCITCPWHGWQYRPHDGCSPPPFDEKIPTYPVRILAGRVQVRLSPNPPGTPVDPARPTDPHADAGAPGDA